VTVKPRLVLASALMLFLELALIRWLGSNIVHLSYFTNFVLLGSFLGIGLGFLQSRKRRSILPWSPWILAGLVAYVYIFPVQIDQTGRDLIYFTAVVPSGPPPWVALPIVFGAVALALMGPAEAVGRCFRDLPPLDAYRLDLLGSLVGIALFTALSYLRAPSVAWGAIVAAAFVTLLADRRQRLALTAIPAACLVLTLLLETGTTGVSWSPYYKVTTEDTLAPDGTTSVLIRVNGVPHQAVRSAALRLREEPQYALPYQRLTAPLGRVLVIGAGSGSDVAIALARGARHVDAVEIDPRILQIGRERHPDRPYDDPRVSTHVDDGRAFLEQSDQTYDLILFALPDSLALVTGASAIRLESYLFTRQAIEAARAHLAPGGGFAMYNYYREDWLIDRLGGTVADVFGHPPCLDRVQGAANGQAVVAAGLAEADQTCAPDQPALPADRVAPATDDRPFLYFRGGALPTIYLIALAGVLLLSVLAIRLVGGGALREMRPYADLFFMGAAFLLLETKNITSFALLFGTTWVVNAIVFAGVLAAVLLAVETTRRFPTPSLGVMYAAIAGSLSVAYLVPNSVLLALPLWPRVVVAVALAFTPIFMANVAFAKRFAQTEDARAAFAVNILGAMVGGCLEYLALLTGYRDLLILTGLLYLAAFALAPRRVPAIAASA
jgi:hypothetical protein